MARKRVILRHARAELKRAEINLKMGYSLSYEIEQFEIQRVPFDAAMDVSAGDGCAGDECLHYTPISGLC